MLHCRTKTCPYNSGGVVCARIFPAINELGQCCAAYKKDGSPRADFKNGLKMNKKEIVDVEYYEVPNEWNGQEEFNDSVQDKRESN